MANADVARMASSRPVSDTAPFVSASELMAGDGSANRCMLGT
jgi:hypothetical protein